MVFECSERKNRKIEEKDSTLGENQANYFLIFLPKGVFLLGMFFFEELMKVFAKKRQLVTKSIMK
jgi:hypothetical protein